jgi:ParB family chromosome partitioning protein
MTDQIVELDLNSVDPPVDGDREAIDPDSVRELAESIRSQGLLQPILVRPVNGRYETVAGNRRRLAHLLIGSPTIKSIIKELGDEETFLIRAIENDQRVDLNPIERAKNYRRLRDKFGWSNEKLSQRMGKGLTTIKRHLRLLEVPDEYQKEVAHGRLGIAVAICLNEIDDEVFRKMYFTSAVENGITIEVAEQWVMDWKKTKLNLGPNDQGSGGEFQATREILPVFATCVACMGPAESTKVQYLPLCPECVREVRGALRPKKT